MKSTIFISIFVLCVIFTSMSSYAQGSSTVVNLSVDGMVSGTCPMLLKAAVKKIKGVKNVQASLETKSATIEFDENVVTLKDIQKTIEDKVGFSTALR